MITTHYKSLLALVCALFLSAFAPSAVHAGDDTPVPAEQLPAPAQAFVKEHFAAQKIALVMHDKGWIKSTYDVTLNDGTEIEFSEKGEWLDIEMKGKKNLPESVIPVAILKHLKENHADSPAIEIARKRYGFKVELRNDLELRFNKEGKFIGFDD